MNDVMYRKRAWRIWGILKRQLSWELDREREGSTFGAQWLDEFARYGRRTRWGLAGWLADGKASIERLCLSPYVEKPFNSKVIKSFVPELRSRKCFSCFGIHLFYVYMLWTLYVCFTYFEWLVTLPLQVRVDREISGVLAVKGCSTYSHSKN